MNLLAGLIYPAKTAGGGRPKRTNLNYRVLLFNRRAQGNFDFL